MNGPPTNRSQRTGKVRLVADLGVVVGILSALALQKYAIATTLAGVMAMRLLTELAAALTPRR